MKKLTTVLLVIMTLAVNLSAQNKYLIEVSAGKTILHASEVKLPETTTLGELLTNFPELLSRTSAKVLDNYDIQVNDVSVEASRDVFLEQLRLGDIKDIEVSKNPSTSQQKNGQGGVIKVILKDIDDGTSGKVNATLGYTKSAVPTAVVNYKKGKLDLRSYLIMNYAMPMREIENEYTLKKEFKENRYVTDTSLTRSGYEHLQVLMKYKSSDYGLWKAWFRESYSMKGVEHTIANYDENGQLLNGKASSEKYLSIYTGGNYEYKTSKWAVKSQIEYTLAPGKESITSSDLKGSDEKFNFQDYTSQQTIKGQVKGTAFLAPSTKTSKFELVGGADCSFTPSKYDYAYTGPYGPLQIDDGETGTDLKGVGNFVYLSPFIEINAVKGNNFAKAGLRFQNYNYSMDTDQNNVERFYSKRNDFTAFINLGVQLTEHRHLSLILDRSIIRPNSQQIYPYNVYDPLQKAFNIGNPDINSSSYHTASLTYITDYHFRNDRDLTLSLSAEYIKGTKLINATSKYFFINYNNDGQSDIANLNGRALYSQDVFSVSLTGNLFQNWTYANGQYDKYFYYNLSLTPMLQFNNGWGVSTQFTYNSHIKTKKSTLSDYFYSRVRFNKSMKRLIIFLELSDNFHEYAEDQIFEEDATVLKYYNLHRPSFNLGITWKF